MICKAYSVLLVICITCLLIFSKFDEETTDQLLVVPLSGKVSKYASLHYLSDTELSKDSISSSEADSSAAVADNKDMENNNTRIEDMDPTNNVKSKSPEPGEDAADGTYAGHFNIKKLNSHLKKCIRENDQEVDMDEYIQTFQQLYKFFCMLGTVFGFIGSDVKSKIEILQGYREGSNKTHYETVEKMLEFEKSTDYIHSNKESSGSRTFLRLHRSLIFVSKFLSKVDTIGDNDGTSRISKDAYAQTLAKFHPWLIQKGAGIAMLGLPTKKDLIAKVCANSMVECEEVTPIMHDVIQLTSDIYDQCDKLYTQHDLHGLP